MSRMLARDIRSTLGKNLRLIAELAGMNPWTAPLSVIQEALVDNETVPVPQGDEWRIPFLWKLLKLRSQAYYAANDEDVETLSSYIRSLVIN